VQTAQGAPKRTFTATFALFGWLAMAGFAIAFAVALPVAHPQGTPETLASQLTGATVGAAFVTFFLHLAHCRVTASASALTVVQPIRRYVFPWEQVADVVVGGNGGMRIVLTDRSSIAVFGFGGSLIGAFTGGIRARKARDGIKAVMAQAASHEPAHPVNSALGIQWKIALVIWAALIALSVAGWLMAPHHVLA
jgi:Bacterial PH domain